jgi:hypothetical protein
MNIVLRLIPGEIIVKEDTVYHKNQYTKTSLRGEALAKRVLADQEEDFFSKYDHEKSLRPLDEDLRVIYLLEMMAKKPVSDRRVQYHATHQL